jgi:hypothetical protein
VGNAEFSNTVTVTGATTLSNTLNVTGQTTLSSNLNITASANLSQTLYVGANVIVNTSTIHVGNSTVNTVITGGVTTTNTGNFIDRVSVGNASTNTVITSSQLQVNSIFVANTTKVEANSILIGLKGLDVTGTSDLAQIIEKANLISSAPTTPATNIDILNGSVVFYLNNMTSNFTINFRGNSTTTLNSLLATGDSLSIALIVSNGTTSYYPTSYTIDTSVSVTPKWQGGLIPSSGTASSYDIYTFTIVKYSASPQYHVFATQSFFS